MLIISPEILEDGTLNNMDFQQGYTDNLLLIPDPMACEPRSQLITGKLRWFNSLWIWDQSLLTVEINTITRGQRHRARDGTVANGVPAPRSIVTDHYQLDSISAGKTAEASA